MIIFLFLSTYFFWFCFCLRIFFDSVVTDRNFFEQIIRFFSYQYECLSFFVSKNFFSLCFLFRLIQISFGIEIHNWWKTTTIWSLQNQSHLKCILLWIISSINYSADNLHKRADIVLFFDYKFRFDHRFRNEMLLTVWLLCSEFCTKFVTSKKLIEDFDSI